MLLHVYERKREREREREREKKKEEERGEWERKKRNETASSVCGRLDMKDVDANTLTRPE